ncbi:ABATE domain-containing protein [Streptomyces sp. NBC_00249]|uniref:CGNR zinc finger domain-containing protein n=1 Tax=Streptomyces sp. NBC_00249 TaxID=2975690 RepID=UPI0022505D4D|nr:ABATE domain-containing protein [Streptomyces sp. NBC_00249]MCX5195262.1 ABATE domain-containing protein [Streptomyces sp. NBC_00249]
MTPAGRPAPHPDPLMAFPFIGGRLCLNFAATLGKRHTSPVERLATPADLGRWFAEAGLVTGGEPDGGGPSGAPRVTAGQLASARALRESLYALLSAAREGRGPEPEDLLRVNAAAARPDLAPQLGPAPSAVTWSGGSTAAALSTVARDAVLLAGGPLVGRVKECENPECSLLFLDDSQARRRRWCSMDRCGNRAKIAGYRSRTRG